MPDIQSLPDTETVTLDAVTETVQSTESTTQLAESTVLLAETLAQSTETTESSTVQPTEAPALPTESSTPQPTPRRPKVKRGPLPRPDHCLNCGQPTGDNFCPRCGQENEDETVALKLLISDFLSDLISFDSRLMRTMIPLVVRRGFLTNEYNAGRRVRYLSPFKLYITMSVLFFILLPLTKPGSVIQFNDKPTSKAISHEAAKQTNAQRKETDAQIKDVRDQMKDANADLKDAGVNFKIGPPPTNRGKSLASVDSDFDPSDLPATVEAYDARQRDPHVKHDPPMVQYLKRQVIKVRQSPQALSQALIDYIPKMMFLLLPAFAFSLKIIYLRSRRLYIEHLIFALHLHAFIFLMLSLAVLMQKTAWHSLADGVAALIVAVYPLIAMRVVYKQGWLKTFIKYNLLAFNYVLLLALTLAAATAIAFLLM